MTRGGRCGPLPVCLGLLLAAWLCLPVVRADEARAEGFAALEARIRVTPVYLPALPPWRFALTPTDRAGLRAEALRHADRANSPAARAQALALAAEAGGALTAEAIAQLDEARHLAGQAGSPQALAAVHLAHAALRHAAGDPLAGRAHGQRALQLSVQGGDPAAAARALSLLDPPSGRRSDLATIDVLPGLARPGSAAGTTSLAERWHGLQPADASAGRRDVVEPARWLAFADALRAARGGGAGNGHALASIASDDSQPALARALAELALAAASPVAAEARIGRARAIFAATGQPGGLLDAALLEAEIAMRAGDPRKARRALDTAAAAAAGYATERGRIAVALAEARLAAMNRAEAEAQGRLGPALAVARARAADGLAKAPGYTRLPSDQVAVLLGFARDNPLLVGGADQRSFDVQLEGLRGFRRWAAAQGDPLLLMISAGGLAKLSEQAGYAADALYYRALREQYRQRYRASVPFESRLRRSAWLTYDLMRERDLLGLAVRARSAPPQAVAKDMPGADWRKLIELDDEAFIATLGLDALMEAFVRPQGAGGAGRDERPDEVRKAFGPDDEDPEARLAELRDKLRIAVGKVLPRIRAALAAAQAFDAALSAGDAQAGAVALGRVRAALGELKLIGGRQWHYSEKLSQSVQNWTFTANPAETCAAGEGAPADAPPCPEPAGTQHARSVIQIESNYYWPEPTYLPLELMHSLAVEDFDWALVLAAHGGDADAVEPAVAELLAFYELYRDGAAPPEELDVPERFRAASGLEVDVESRIEAALEARKAAIDAELDAHMARYEADLKRQALAEAGVAKWPRMEEMQSDLFDPDHRRDGSILDRPAATRYLEDAFLAGPERVRVLRHEMHTRDTAEGRETRIEHAYELNLALRPDGPLAALPRPRHDADLAGGMAALERWLSAPPDSAGRPNLTDLVEAFLADAEAQGWLTGTLADRFGRLAELAAQHQSLIIAGQVALGVQGVDGDIAPLVPGADFASLRDRLRADPKLEGMIRGLAQAQLELAATRHETPGQGLAGMIDGFQRTLTAHLAPGTGDGQGADDALRGLTEAVPLMAVAGQPALAFELLGDTERARQYRALLAEQLDEGKRHPGGVDAGDASLLRRQLAIAALARDDCAEGLRRLDAIDAAEGAADHVLRYQTGYLAALCHRRLGAGDAAAWRSARAIDDLEATRSRLRARSLTVLLGPVRQLLYELRADLLHETGEAAALLETVMRYRTPSALPVSLRAARGETIQQALLEDIALAYDLERLAGPEAGTRGAGAGLWSAVFADLIASVAETAGAVRQHGHPAGAQRALDSLANILAAELAQPRAEPHAGSPTPAGNGLLLAYFLGSRRGYAMTVAPDGVTRSFVLPATTAEIAEHVARLRRAVQAQTPADEDGAWLHRTLLAGPLAGTHAVRLRIAPDGPLWQLPFAMLRAAPDQPYLVESHLLGYVSGIESAPAVPGRAGEGPRILVVADPDGSLPSAREEAVRIASAMSPGGVATLVGEAATRVSLARALPTATAVHFATHAAFAPEAANFSSLALHGGEQLPAIDLAGLDFSGKELFLSACETQLGQLVPGEDPYGVAHAFLAAGASSIVATQWRVNSAATAVFAARYYDERAAGASADEALALTARAFLSGEEWLDRRGEVTRLDQPYYWAPFGYLAPQTP
jgi:CHAT domain-containing protein